MHPKKVSWILSAGILTAMLIPSKSVEAKTDLRFGPVLIERSSSDQIILTYEDVCQGRLKGFAFRPMGEDMHIGVVMASKRLACTSLGDFKTVTVPGIKYSSFRKIYGINPITSGTIVERPMSQIQLLREPVETAPTYSLQALFSSKCGKAYGYMVSPAFKISFLERMPRGERPCAPRQRLASLSGLKLHKNIKPKIDKKESYKLMLRPIRRPRQKGGSLHFQYLRRCNEAPLGPLVAQRNKKNSYKIAMVVARYPKMVCAAKAKELMWSSYKSKHLNLARHNKFSAMKIKHKRVSVLSPFGANAGPGHVSIEAPQTCQPFLGVHLVEKGGRLFAAAVAPKGAITRCHRPLKAVTYTLTGLGSKALAPIKPLHLKN